MAAEEEEDIIPEVTSQPTFKIVVTTGDYEADEEIIANAKDEIEQERNNRNTPIAQDSNIEQKDTIQSDEEENKEEKKEKEEEEEEEEVEKATSIGMTSMKFSTEIAADILSDIKQDIDDNDDNESELSQDTDEEDGNDDYDSSLSLDEFDLIDSDQLQDMMTVRDELKIKDENKKLMKMNTSKSAQRNVFVPIQKRQSRDPLHNAMIDAAALAKQIKTEENEQPIINNDNDDNNDDDTDDDDEYIKKMETELTKENLKSNGSVGVLNNLLVTEDFNGPTMDEIKEEKSTDDHDDDDGDGEIIAENEILSMEEFPIRRRIFFILRFLVVIYLYISSIFQFAFLFNENEWSLRVILLLIFGWICDIFMWINLYYEYLNYRDEQNAYDKSTKAIIDDINESGKILDKMRDIGSNRKGTQAHKKDLENTMRQFAEMGGVETLKNDLNNNNNNNDDNNNTSNDNRWLNRLIRKYFPDNYSQFQSYRLTHKIKFDFMVNFPFDIFILCIEQNWKLFIIFRLLKLLHTKRFFEYFKAAFGDKIPDKGVWRSAFVSRLAKLIITGLAWIHLWTCIWFFLGSNLFIDDITWNNGDVRSYINNNNATDTWLTAYHSKLNDISSNSTIDNIPNHEYLWSIYFTTVTFSTVGYGDIVPMNEYEIILLIIFQLINYVFITIFVAELAPVIEEFGFRHLSRSTQHRMLKNCFDSIHIDRNEQDKIRDANRYRWRNQYGMDENEIYLQLPYSLSMEMKYQFLERSFYSFIKHLINKANLKNEKPEKLIPWTLIRKMANECHSKTYIKEQIILSENVENNLLYFLIDGKVRRESQDENHNIETKEISNYPNFFGQESFWRQKTTSKCTYTSLTITKCFVISSKQIRDILKPCNTVSDRFREIFKTAYPALKKNNNINDQETLRRREAIQYTIDDPSIIKPNDIRYNLYKNTSLIYDIANGIFIIIQCFSFIWAISFFSTSINYNKEIYFGPLILNWIIDILFFADIIFSIYPNKFKFVYWYPSRAGGENKKKREKNNLIKDFLTVFPFEIFLLINKSSSWRTVYIYLFRILKWLRIRYISKSWESWVEFLRSIHIPSRFTRMIIFIIAIIHCFGCIWYLVGRISYEEISNNLNWLSNDISIKEDDGSDSLSRSLLRSWYFIMITETTIGYGGIVGYAVIEIIYAIFLVTIGSLLYWICISFFAMHGSYQQFTRIQHTNLVSATEFLLTKQHPNFQQENRVISDINNDNKIDENDKIDNKIQKEIDQKENDELMVRLQSYFDFVLQQREGAVSFWDEQKPSLQSVLRYQLLNNAFQTKKDKDYERYRFLEWLPDETILQFAQHLNWIVVCKGQSIKIKQSGSNSLVLFLVTGTLWSPYSKYIFTRHAKDKDRINKSEIITFNLQCLSPINLKVAWNNDPTNNNDKDNQITPSPINATQTLSTYLQIDCDKDEKFKDLYDKMFNLYDKIFGLYEISNAKQIGFTYHTNKYDIIYQQIPPDQQQREEQQEKDGIQQDNIERTLTFLVYQQNPNDSPVLPQISENEANHSDNDDIDNKDNNDKQLGQWMFFSMKKQDGKFKQDSKDEIAIYKITGNEKSINPIHIDHNKWNISNKEENEVSISIGDELFFEALECCDIVQLYQKDAYDSFKQFYQERLKKYIAKSNKTDVALYRRGSVLSPKSNLTLSTSKSRDEVAKLIMNDPNQFSFKKFKNKKRNSVRSSTKLLTQFKDKKVGISHQTSIRGDDLLRQENLLNKTGTITQPPKLKEYIKQNKEIKIRVESIISSDRYRIVKILWYLTGLCFISIWQFLLPQRAIFFGSTPFKYFSFDIITQIYFIIDLFVQWNIFKKKEKTRSSQRRLQFLDWFITIPWPFIGLADSWTIYYYFRLIDLLRISRLKHYWNDMRRELVHYTGRIISIHAGLSAIIFHIFALLLIASYCCCGWYLVGNTSWRKQESKPVYFDTINDDNNEDIKYYDLSMYWAIVSMSSVGFGDLKPITSIETMFALITLPFMVGFYIRFMGDMASFAGNIDANTKTVFYQKFTTSLLALNRRIDYLKIFATQEKEKELIDLKRTIRKYLLSLFKDRAGMSENEIYQQLPYFLTRDIAYQCRKKYLHSIPCLTKLIESTNPMDIELCKTIAIRLDHHIITRNDQLLLTDVFVVEKGEIRLIEVGDDERGDDLIGKVEEEGGGEQQEEQEPEQEQNGMNAIKDVEEVEENKENIEQQEMNDNAVAIDEMEDAGAHNRRNQHNNVLSTLFNKMNLNNLTPFENTQSAQYQVYLPPYFNNKKRFTLFCNSDSASLYSLSYETLLNIQDGYNETDQMYNKLTKIIKDYHYDVNDRDNRNVSKVHQTQTQSLYDNDNNDNNSSYYSYYHSSDYNVYKSSKSVRTMKVALDDFADKNKTKSTRSKYLRKGEEDNKDYYRLSYSERKIFRRTHPLRLGWDIICTICWFLYLIILPLQFSNIFYDKPSMINALIISLLIDAIFVIDFILRFFYFAPHPIKMLDPYYVMIGRYINVNSENDDDPLKKKYKDKLEKKYEDHINKEYLIYRDLPNKRYDTRAHYLLILEIIAMIPLNMFGIIPSLGSIKNMNIWFRINKVIYIFLLFNNANKSINSFVAKQNIYFLSARIFRISVLTIIILHWMACIWLQFAQETEEDETTWLTEMDQKRLIITSWKENPGYAYLLSLYFVAVTMTTTGYGDITPVTINEIRMTCIIVIFGDALMALMAGALIQYISNINQSSLNIAIKEKSVTRYLNHRKEKILSRSKEIVDKIENNDINNNANNDNFDDYAIDKKVYDLQKIKFDKLIKRVGRYFQMQLDYQRKVSTLDQLTKYLPLYYRMRLLRALFERYFIEYPFLYNNKDLYSLILDNIQEQIYTYWEKDNLFDYLIDPQQTKATDFMIIQFGECHVIKKKEWKKRYTADNIDINIERKMIAGDFIGFQSLILQNSNFKEKKQKKQYKLNYIVRPKPANRGDNYSIVSILRIPNKIWTEIIDSVLPNEIQDNDGNLISNPQRIKFENDVETFFSKGKNKKHDTFCI